jgi:hypothetical protein
VADIEEFLVQVISALVRTEHLRAHCIPEHGTLIKHFVTIPTGFSFLNLTYTHSFTLLRHWIYSYFIIEVEGRPRISAFCEKEIVLSNWNVCEC